MPFKEQTVFLLKCFFAVVFLLVRNVLADGGSVGFTDGKGTITCLPRKANKFISLCFNPFGRGFFDLFHRLADRYGAGKFKKHVNMILHGVDEHRIAAQVLEHGGHVGVQRISHSIGDEVLAVLGAEDKMDIETRERLRHGIGRPFRAGDFIADAYPGRCPGLSLGRAVGAFACAMPDFVPSGERIDVAEDSLPAGWGIAEVEDSLPVGESFSTSDDSLPSGKRI